MPIKPVVLVVDDERYICELLCEILDLAGYATVAASNYQEAIMSFSEHSPDAVLTDWHYGDGYVGGDLLTTLERSMSIRGVAAVVYAGPHLAADCFCAARNITRLEKPSPLETVVMAVDHARQASRPALVLA